jgi:hypothetical protein
VQAEKANAAADGSRAQISAILQINGVDPGVTIRKKIVS